MGVENSVTMISVMFLNFIVYTLYMKQYEIREK